MLFYKTIEGKENGIFPYEYRENRKDEGSLHEFPYIMLSGNLSLINKDYERYWQEIAIEKLDKSISDIYILILDYDSTLNDIAVDFTCYDSQLLIQYNSECNIEIPLNCSTKGAIYVVCRIKKEEGEINIINESKCISLDEANSIIPGFELICSK